MAIVGFKKGTQSELNTLMGQPLRIEDGTFYLTTDTHRLYIGQTIGTVQSGISKTIVPVNQGINIVEYISTEDENYQAGGSVLPAVEQGQFYYVSSANVLCIGSGEHWVQINPPVKEEDIAAIVADEVENQLTTIVNTEITNQLNLLNPMRYIGVIEVDTNTPPIDATKTASALFEDDAEWGLVYKAANNFVLPQSISVGKAASTNVKAGDLLISEPHDSTVAEGTANNTVWAVIPSGDETLTWGSFGN